MNAFKIHYVKTNMKFYLRKSRKSGRLLMQFGLISCYVFRYLGPKWWETVLLTGAKRSHLYGDEYKY